jgi:uncharacterized protein
MNEKMREKRNTLERVLQSLGSTLIALSGGIDSMLLSFISQSLLGEKSFSVTVDSEFFIPQEKAFIDGFVKDKQIRHEYFTVSVLADDALRKNPSNRCYLCKKLIFRALTEYGKKRGFSSICDGTNMDDLLEDRPGLRALEELQIVSPYVQAGLGKKDILDLARAKNLEKYIRPSNTCLATRIHTDSDITGEKLRMVADAEEFMKKLGFPVVRVRFHDPYIARIEVGRDSLGALWMEETLIRVKDAFRRIGFQRTAIDIEGYVKPCVGNEKGKKSRGD